jgi:hypothetical protein
LNVAVVVIASILCTVEDLGQASATHQYTPEILSSIIAALVSIELRCSGYIHIGLELWSKWPRIKPEAAEKSNNRSHVEYQHNLRLVIESAYVGTRIVHFPHDNSHYLPQTFVTLRLRNNCSFPHCASRPFLFSRIICSACFPREAACGALVQCPLAKLLPMSHSAQQHPLSSMYAHKARSRFDSR